MRNDIDAFTDPTWAYAQGFEDGQKAEPSTEQTTHETMSAAYDQGAEDGVRQERERIREALVNPDTARHLGVEVLHLEPARLMEWLGELLDLCVEAASHIGLGAVTTEESEK